MNKYICEYIGKIDKQNYIIVIANNIDRNGAASLLTKSIFLYNTKITLLKIQEDKDRIKDTK